MADKFILGFPISDKTADSVLYQDGSNVGIGVADPDAKLEVVNSSGGSYRLGYAGTDSYFDSENFYIRAGNGNSNKLIVNAAGNVGIGTTSPNDLLELKSDGANAAGAVIRLNHANNNSTDVIGTVNFSNNAGSAAMIQGGTSGANNSGYISFFTDNAGSSSEKMRITSDGKVFFSGLTSSEAGIASNGIEASCDSANAFTAAFNQKNTGSYATLALSHAHTSGTEKFMWFYVNNYSGSGVGSISTNGTSTSYNTTSDYRLKENVVDITGALNRLDSLNPRRFNFISDDTTTVDGFIAHEVQTVVPEAVLGTQDEVDDDGNAVYQGIDQSKLVPLLTAALQEAHTIIKDLKSRVETLENA